ncbi:MAG: energy transducer TonB [Lentimicrobiaceae bacterium]|nr:energy transducer TonB [Lentimicrobiaceae bacterium]
MKKLGFIVAVLFIGTVFNPVAAQKNKKSVKNKEVVNNPEELPEFPGGEEARQQFLWDNTVYPREAKKQKLEGSVVIGFVVEADGSVSNVKVVRGVHPLLDEEAVRVTKMMPNWKPGTQDGKKVRVQYRMPIRFVFDEDEKKQEE